MSKTWRKLLSVLLALSMVVSLTVTGYAAGSGGRTKNGLEEIDSAKLNVPRLGQLTEGQMIDEDANAYSLADIVRVSIVLEQAPTLEKFSAQNVAENTGAMAYRGALKVQQRIITNKIESALGGKLDVKWNLTLAMNAISANVRYGDIARIREVAGVKSVELENRYDPMTAEKNTANTTDAMVGATALWTNGYTGAGTRIAIIDTGTDQDHQSFDAEALEYALEQVGGEHNLLTWEEISSKADLLNAKVNESVYKNTKLPYAYNYVDKTYNTDHMSDTQEEHGSHVAGISAANRFVKVDGEFVAAADNVFAVGVAPDAQIITMKVFGAGGGAYDSDYMVAIEDAIILGCDSCNLSLGSGSPGMTTSGSYQKTMDSLLECGTVVSISAGNSDYWGNHLNAPHYPYIYLQDVSMHTGGSPGTFTNSLGVASADNIGVVGSPLTFNGTQSTYPSETSGYGNEPIATLAGDTEYDYVFIDGPGVNDNNNVGKEGDAFWALGSDVVSGKVAICYRGTSSFFVKANAAVAQGAIAVIIVNNQDGVINMNLKGYTHTAPAVSILKAVGDAVKEESTPVDDGQGNVLYYTGKIVIGARGASITKDRADATISSFSSWGVPGSLIMKPEITAPGGSIYSVFGQNKHSDGTIAGGPAEYELMSGTSMAAPHVAGMAALLGQYIRENKLEEITGVNRRTLINSLLMSTATPMKNDGRYLSILAQGAGLGETNLASQAKAYITMNPDATASWQDGKVKVELGQDAKREGVYRYSFNVNNFSDEDIAYELSTDMFTQQPHLAENLLLTDTMSFTEGEDYTVEYDYPAAYGTPNLHDVSRNGKTDKADAQAILDYLSGKLSADTVDLTVADMDGDGKVTSYDAHLLLVWIEENTGTDTGSVEGLVVPAGQKVTVTVTITLTDELKEALNNIFVNGAYVEGFTYVTAKASAEGVIPDVEHSIPILGFYGSWTDASMFDCTSPIEAAYGSTKVAYTNLNNVANYNTNYLSVNYGKGASIFMGNPYLVEDEFPADRLALNGDTGLVEFRYNLIRNAASTGFLALDEEYKVLKGSLGGAAQGAYYHVNQGAWQNTATKSAAIGGKVSGLGVREGDKFTLGYFAIPEYYGIMLQPGKNITSVTAAEAAQLLKDGELGKGSYVGYTFTVDNTAPVIDNVTVSKDSEGKAQSIIVTAHDDRYIAAVMLMDVYGNTVYAQKAPAQSEAGETVEVTFEISEEMGTGVAVVVGDYAANEMAGLARLGDGPITARKTVYKPVTAIEAGKNYVLVNATAAGNAKSIIQPASNLTVMDAEVDDVIVLDDDGVPFVDLDDTQSVMLWTAKATSKADAFHLQNVARGKHLGYSSSTDGSTVRIWSSAYDRFAVNAETGVLELDITSGRVPVAYDAEGNKPIFQRPADGVQPDYFYVYGETTIEVEFDPTQALGITVTPEETILVVDRKKTAQLTAEVKPALLEDKSVTWTSDDQNVVTVDENGVVTAVNVGETTVTATTNAEPHLTATATIRVEEVTANADIRGLLRDESGKGVWTLFNSDDTENWDRVAEAAPYNAVALYEDVLYAVDGKNMFVIDADTYETTTLGEIVDQWCYTDGAPLPADMAAAWSNPGLKVGGPCNNGTYFEFINPEAGKLNYFDLSSDYASDPMATVAYVGRDAEQNALYYVITEGGALWQFSFNMEGKLSRTKIGATGMQLSGVAGLNNWASMVYDEASGYLFLSYYGGDGDVANLYAINASEPAINCELGNFRTSVWPVVGLYQYEPATDLVLKVAPTELTFYESQKAELRIKVKMGDTNEYTAEIADPGIVSLENGVITGLKAGETTITITTNDVNDANEHLSETVRVVVKPRTSIDAFVMAQVTDDRGARFAKISLEDLSVSNNSVEAPGSIVSGGRGGDIYMADKVALNAEDMTTPVDYTVNAYWAQYPGQDFANYPVFRNGDGELVESKSLMTINMDWLVTPDTYSGFNLSTLIKGMAGVAFLGTNEVEGVQVYQYAIINTEGVLYTFGIDFVNARRTNPQVILETGIKVSDASALSMAFLQNVGFVGGELAPTEIGLVIANNEDKSVWFIDLTEENAEEAVCFIGMLDAENISGLVGTFDDMVSYGDLTPPPPFDPGPEPADPGEYPEPNPDITGVKTEFGFEANPLENGWTEFDRDNDKKTWVWKTNSNYNNEIAHGGEGFMTSASYEGKALKPDNFLISPAINLSAETDANVAFYAKGMDGSYASEVFAIYAGTTPVVSEMTKISEDFTTTGAWKQYMASLVNFAGEEEVYVAIRHYNVTGMFVLVVDDLQILTADGASGGEAPAVPNKTYSFKTAGKNYTAVKPAFATAQVGDGIGLLDRAPSADVEMRKLGEATNAVVGSTNAVIGESAAAVRTLDDIAAVVDVNPVITISEEVAVTNGLYEIKYDSAKLTFVKSSSGAAFTSVNNDEENGVLTIALANLEEMPAGAVIALTFKPSCDNSTVAIITKELNEQLDLNESVETKISGLGHEWGEPVWTWNSNYTGATAKFVCANDETHVEEIEATVTKEIILPTDEEEGRAVYTATVMGPDGKTYTDTQVTAILNGWQQEGSNWRYYENGEAVTGWKKIRSKWYYFDAEGIMQTGWLELKGKRYYLSNGGVMQTGLQEIDGEKYYFSDNGAMQTGWQKLSRKWYYFNSEGMMQTGWQEIGSNRYYFDAEGVMQTGWQTLDGNLYYFSGGGALLQVSGWQKLDNKWYYFSEESAAQTEWQKIDGNWYYFGTDGVMRTGWQDINGYRYYFRSGGIMHTGWRQIDNNWYYFRASGVMVANTSLTIGGKTYHFDASGICTNP